MSKFMIGILSFVVVFVLVTFVLIQNKNLKAKNLALESDVATLKEQIMNKDKAALYRQEKYQQLEEEYNQLNQQMEELNDKESINWLDTIIPNNVDNTIPY